MDTQCKADVHPSCHLEKQKRHKYSTQQRRNRQKELERANAVRGFMPNTTPGLPSYTFLHVGHECALFGWRLGSDCESASSHTKSKTARTTSVNSSRTTSAVRVCASLTCTRLCTCCSHSALGGMFCSVRSHNQSRHRPRWGTEPPRTQHRPTSPPRSARGCVSLCPGRRKCVGVAAYFASVLMSLFLPSFPPFPPCN